MTSSALVMLIISQVNKNNKLVYVCFSKKSVLEGNFEFRELK